MTTAGQHIENGLKAAAAVLTEPLTGIVKGLSAVAHEIERVGDQLQLGILPDIQPDPGYTVEIGDQRFTQAQWEAVQRYTRGRTDDTTPTPGDDHTITSADADRLPEWSIVETTDHAREQITLWVVHEGFTEIGGEQWIQTLADRGDIRLIRRAGAE